MPPPPPALPFDLADVTAPPTATPITGARLRCCGLLSALSDAELDAVAHYLDTYVLPAETVVVHEGDLASSMFFVLGGEAHLKRQRVDLRPLRAGDAFGEIGLVTGRPRAATITATTTLELARLTRSRFDAMITGQPALAVSLLQALVARVGDELVGMTDSMGLLLSERSLPRRTEVSITTSGVTRRVAMATSVRSVLPPMVGDAPVVAALVGRKAVSLSSRLLFDADVEPLTTTHWEGRDILRHSAGLLALEAAHRVDPELRMRLDGTLGGAQVLDVDGEGHDFPALATKIGAELAALVAADVPIREELWTVDEARAHFAEQGWDDAVKLLQGWRTSRVTMVSCGRLYALSPGPLLPSTGMLDDVLVVPAADGLRLQHGDAMRRHLPRVGPRLEDGPPPDDSEMAREQRRWLRTLGVTSVGAFNERCVSGKIGELIRVSEGFHEKRIGLIADRIVAARPRVRVICIAGPSSSGKTTFIHRLTVQLQVNGVNPVAVSLDDYYVDREKTPRDASGEYDFESFSAIDSALLRSQIGRAVAGDRIATARYDFKTGRSNPTGGREISLGPTDVLMLEGIHGLNPGLLGLDVPANEVFRVFIHPATALPMDRLTPVSTSDVRLVRRIVRDRHGRGYRAADTIARWPSVRRGEREHIFPFLPNADVVFDSSLPFELSVLKVYADQYLLEVPQTDPAYTTAFRLRSLIDRYVTIYPEHVPPTSILREFIGGSGFEY